MLQLDHEGTCKQILRWKILQNTLSQPRAKHGNFQGQASPPIICGGMVRSWFMRNHSFLFISVILYTLLSSIVCYHPEARWLSLQYRVILLISKITS